MTTRLDAIRRLAALIKVEREPLLAEWRARVRQLPSAQHLDVPNLNDDIPELLDELAEALMTCDDAPIGEALVNKSPPAHGLQRFVAGFDILELIAEYNMLRGCIHDFAVAGGIDLQGTPFHILNRVLDGAIGLSVQSFATERALEIQQRREEYLAFLAHDLRTPLHAIALAAKVLEMTASAANADTDRTIKSLRRNVQQLEGLIDRVIEENANLETEGGIRVVRRHFDLWPLVESLVHDLRPLAADARVELHNRVPDELVAFADASLLRRVLQNLLVNAIHYTPGGKVEIGARQFGDDAAIECWVKDDGAGIPAAFIDKIFDKGHTDPAQEGGTGLGLAVARMLVEGHGGTIWVESVEGDGATFRFKLPGSPATPQQGAAHG